MARPRVCSICVCLALVCIVVIIIVCATLLPGPGCSDGAFKKAAVAADSETCSKIGRDMLQLGGSAVDGAIAALLCTSVINPQSMGIGGGSIFTILDKDGKVKIINARETVPTLFRPDLLKECRESFGLMTGSQWMGVPGEVRGYELAHRLFGRLPWSTLFQPSISLARHGFPLPHMLSLFLPFLNRTDTLPLRALFLDKEGNMLKEGDILRFEKLADTLETVAKHGADAFYTGDIARDLISDIQDAGGSLSLEDLGAFGASVSEPWSVALGEYDMHFPPPPAGGATLSLILNIMRGYNLGPDSLQGKQKILTYHRFSEACKFANGLKKFIKDPSFSSATEAFNMTQEVFAEHVRALISSDRTHDAQYYNATPGLDSMGTTHLSVLAEDGSAVAVTSTINGIFGSMVYSPKTGVILNNQLSDFCKQKPNRIHTGEQPASSMAPAILVSKAKQHTLVTGGSGGSMITTAMALTIMNQLWFGRTLEEAISAPMLFVDSKNVLKFEPRFDKAVVEALTALGHTVEFPKTLYNVINAVSKQHSCIHAVSDARKMGKAAGY